MQGPQALANTVPSISLRDCICPSLSIVARTSSEPGGEALERELGLREESPFLSQDLTYHSRLYRRDQMADVFALYRTAKSMWVWQHVRRPPIYRTDDSRLGYCLRILEHLRELTEQRGAHLVVLLLGNNNTFGDRIHRGIDRPWRLLEKKLAERSIVFLNTADRMSDLYSRDPDSIINSFGVHYTPLANEVVANQLMESGFLHVVLGSGE